MEIFTFFRDILSPSSRENRRINDPRSQYLRTEDDPSNLPSGIVLFDESGTNNEETMGFPVFSNPVEMHRFFEKQMNDMLKSFGFAGNDSFFGMFEGGAPGQSFDTLIEGPDTVVPDNGSLRDQYLKPGYQEPTRTKSDTDLDGQIQPDDIDTMFNSNAAITPYQPQPRFRSFGQSVSTKVVRNADGSVETHRTSRDSAGNEVTVVTSKRGDQEYTITTKTDQTGKKEITENFVNLDEKDLLNFLNKKREPLFQEEPVVPKTPQNWFPFDKFFK